MLGPVEVVLPCEMDSGGGGGDDRMGFHKTRSGRPDLLVVTS